MSSLLPHIVGEDFTTLTGKEVSPAVFDKTSKFALVTILIHADLLPEVTECFTAELQSESTHCISSSTICIVDAHIVLYSFQQPEYSVYESTGHVILTLNTSSSIASDFEVYVDIIHGIGNASGE